MVDLGKLARTVKKVVDTKGDKIAAGVGKATDFVDKKTKGRFHDKLEKVDAAAEKLDKTADRAADAGPEAPPPPPAPPPAAAPDGPADAAPEEPPAPSGPPA